MKLALLFLLALATTAPAQRLVFAHYMLANRDYASDTAPVETQIASYEREIRQAQAIGIDGFALNAGGWLREPRYILRASEMFEAAYRLHTHFLLFFSADMCCSNTAPDLLDMVRRFANNSRYGPIYFRHNGRFVLTTFAGSSRGPAFWSQLRSDLEHGTNPSTQSAPNALPTARAVPSNAPIPVFLIPAFFFGGELPSASAIRSGLAPYANIIDGAFYWGIAGVPNLGHPPDQIPSSHAYADTLQAAHKLYMAPICFQFWGANAGRYYEYSGFSGLRSLWLDAINVTHPQFVEIITWNDFIEGTYTSPIDDPALYPHANDLGASVAPPSTLHFFHTHRGVTALMAFFIQWYKTGYEPPIRNDAVFWAYRTQFLPPDARFTPPIKLYGPVSNTLYLTANLTAPAILRVTLGSIAHTLTLPAGSHDLQVPLTAGPAPTFVLTRSPTPVTRGQADDAIVAPGLIPDFYYSTGYLHD